MRCLFSVLLVSCVLTPIFFPLLAQCSDAGICMIGSHEPTLRHRIELSYIYGRESPSNKLTFNTLQLEGTVHIFQDSRVSFLLPWTHVDGPLGTTDGVGDFRIVWNQSVWHLTEGELSIQLGGKIATGNSNAGNLPQAYQVGLGTNDVILGLAYEREPWIIAAGYQASRGRSDNAITRLRRGDDFLLRAGYGLNLGSVRASGEILAIKRLAESSVLDTAANLFVDVSGSDQFQVNILAKGSIPLRENLALQALAAIPLRSRKVNVDGLTRSMTISISLQAVI